MKSVTTATGVNTLKRSQIWSLYVKFCSTDILCYYRIECILVHFFIIPDSVLIKFSSESVHCSFTHSLKMLNQIWQMLMRSRNKFRNIQRYFQNATPFWKFELVRIATNSILEFLGLNVLSDCKRNWRTPFAGLCAFQYACLTFFTARYYWNENKITSIQPFTIMAVMIPVIIIVIVLQPLHLHQANNMVFNFATLGYSIIRPIDWSKSIPIPIDSNFRWFENLLESCTINGIRAKMQSTCIRIDNQVNIDDSVCYIFICARNHWTDLCVRCQRWICHTNRSGYTFRWSKHKPRFRYQSGDSVRNYVCWSNWSHWNRNCIVSYQ